MRTARDYACGIAVEPSWNRPAGPFERLRLTAEDFQVIGQYASRQALVPDKDAARNGWCERMWRGVSA